MVFVVVIPYQLCLFNESLQKILQHEWEKYVESEAVAPKTPPTFHFPLSTYSTPPPAILRHPSSRHLYFHPPSGAIFERS